MIAQPAKQDRGNEPGMIPCLHQKSQRRAHEQQHEPPHGGEVSRLGRQVTRSCQQACGQELRSHLFRVCHIIGTRASKLQWHIQHEDPERVAASALKPDKGTLGNADQFGSPQS